MSDAAKPVVEFRPIGPRPTDHERLARRVMDHPAVRKALGDHRHRLLSVRYVSTGKKPLSAGSLRRYLATIIDYDANRGLTIDGSVTGRAAPKIGELDTQPPPNHEEWREAVKILRRDKKFGPRVREGRLIPYRAMPLLVDDAKGPDGRPRRVLTVGLRPRKGTRGHGIAGVDMGSRSVILFHSHHGGQCGVPDAAMDYTSSMAGQGAFRIRDPADGSELWTFEVIRPAATEGEYGSGIELRNVRYRRTLVLASAGIPIQNVNYEDLDAGCGRPDPMDPTHLAFIDQMNEESWFQLPPGGRDFGGGIRECLTPPSTILESGSDNGDFHGVAVYRDGLEHVLVSELESGWYRYVMEWRLGDDGTIRPRIAWTAIQNSCVCTVHHHHAYWRFDFDIGSAPRNRFMEFNQPPGAPKGLWTPVTAEKKVDRGRPPPDAHAQLDEFRRMLERAFRSDHETARELRERMEEDLRRSGVLPELGPVRYWRVENVDTLDAYEIVPGWADGSWLHAGHPFGDGDVWLLRQRSTEREQEANGDEPAFHANLDKWVNAEPIDPADVVMWYAVHSTHEGEPGAPHGQLVGPTLRPSRWGIR